MPEATSREFYRQPLICVGASRSRDGRRTSAARAPPMRRGSSMWLQSRFQIQGGAGETLYARLADGSTGWQPVGRVCLKLGDVIVHFDVVAAAHRPLWQQSIEGRAARAVIFGVARRGGFVEVAHGAIVHGEAEQGDGKRRVPDPRCGGPRPVRSTWPQPEQIAASRRR